MAVHTTWFCSQDPLLMPLVPSSQDLPSSSSSSSSSVMVFPGAFPPSQSLLQQIPYSRQKQSLDMDLFFQSESQKLREMVMEEQRRQQRVLLQNYESRIAGLVRQRDAELAMAKNRNRELQDLMMGAELEAKLWEKRAVENEAVVSELSNRLRQAAAAAAVVAEREAEESFCGGGSTSASSAAAEMGTGWCKTCESRRMMSVVFLPCRHLCCCKSCDVFLQLCPVCAAVKEDSLQVILP